MKQKKTSAYNPFLNRNGELVNKFLNYREVLDRPDISDRVKKYISDATGLTPNRSPQKTGAPTEYIHGSAAGVSDPAGSGGNSLVDTAKRYLGTPYVWGGASPEGFDCSGLMQYTFGQNGISIPRTAREQFKSGTAVSQGDLKPGDLVFFKGSKGSDTSPGHVGMYVGSGQYIQAPKTGDVVKISNLSSRKDYVGARRYS